ncbi:MAG: alpha/beta hydrolase [Alphaproteobacteria bacterium]|nr:alpha/beta hydrolase [Alphaproteobacteria bacterium]
MQAKDKDFSVYDKGRGAAVVFMHGWGSSSAAFAPFLEPLARHRRVIAVDLPGFGSSAEPGKPWDVDAYADWVLELLAQKGVSRAVLVGHSFGGRIAIKLASRADSPLVVDKMVLAGSAGIRRKPSLKRRLVMLAARAARPVLGRFPRLADKLRRGLGSADYRTATPLMRETLKKVVAEDLTELLPRVHCPTLLVWGDKDAATPLEDGRKMERLIPGAGLAVFNGAGHYAFLDRPAQFMKVLNVFLGVKE